jgi:ketosteroid isomerase-like protein
MSEESTTPDLAELARRSIEAPDPDAVLSFYAPDAVWDSTPWGMGTFQGKDAVRAFFEDWGSSYARLEWKAEEVLELPQRGHICRHIPEGADRRERLR